MNVCSYGLMCWWLNFNILCMKNQVFQYKIKIVFSNFTKKNSPFLYCFSSSNINLNRFCVLTFQAISAGLFRSDYFYCLLSEKVKQVEFNTIASSFGCLTSSLVSQHKYVPDQSCKHFMLWIINISQILPLMKPMNFQS